jgi:hypothetical protein
MFVADQDSIELFEGYFGGSKARKRFALAESAIDEEAGALRFEQRDVARTAGSQDGDAQAYRSFSEICRAEAPAIYRKQIFTIMAERGKGVNEEARWGG